MPKVPLQTMYQFLYDNMIGVGPPVQISVEEVDSATNAAIVCLSSVSLASTSSSGSSSEPRHKTPGNLLSLYLTFVRIDTILDINEQSY